MQNVPERRTPPPHRRILPRQPTSWAGRYAFEDDPDRVWRPCRVVDVSSAGAGVELAGVTEEQVRGHRLVVEVELRGDVRNSAATRAGGVRVGLQFAELGDGADVYVESLADIDARW